MCSDCQRASGCVVLPNRIKSTLLDTKKNFDNTSYHKVEVVDAMRLTYGEKEICFTVRDNSEVSLSASGRENFATLRMVPNSFPSFGHTLDPFH